MASILEEEAAICTIAMVVPMVSIFAMILFGAIVFLGYLSGEDGRFGCGRWSSIEAHSLRGLVHKLLQYDSTPIRLSIEKLILFMTDQKGKALARVFLDLSPKGVLGSATAEKALDMVDSSWIFSKQSSASSSRQGKGADSLPL